MNIPCKLLLMTLWLCALPQAIAVPDATALPPRAWLVTRGDVAAVIVGESHLDTALEFDPYFKAVVEPSFRAADVALVESYFGPENLVNLGFNLAAPCDTPADGPHGARVAERFAQLAKAAQQLGLEVPPWIVHWDVLPDIALVSAQLPDYITRKISPAIDAALRQPDASLGVSFRLTAPASLAAGKHPRIDGLDTVARVRSHFCAASVADREDYLVYTLDSVIGKLHMLEDVRRTGHLADYRTGMSGAFARTLDCIASGTPCDLPAPVADAALRYGFTMHFSPGFFDLALQKRTHDWLPLVQDAMATHRRTFVVVGAMHLADLRFQGQVHPGLLSLLRQSGYAVTPIRGESDLQEPFLRRRWWERVLAF